MGYTDNSTQVYLCKCLANGTGLPTRIYREKTCAAYHSAFRFSVDPLGGSADKILACPSRAGVVANELMQYYGFFTLPDGCRVIFGPTRAESSDARLLQERLCFLGIPPEEHAEYLRCLNCLPVYSMERLCWMVCFMSTLHEGSVVGVEDLFLNVRPETSKNTVHRDYAGQHSDSIRGTPDKILLENGYRFEQMVLTFIEQGEPERVRELVNAPPSMLFGQLSNDTLHQAKNLAICTATLASRAAIAGGMDSQTAFHISDLYIQQIDLLRDTAAAHRLRSEILIDFANEVQRVRYHVHPEIPGEKCGFFAQCAEYVSQNIFTPIRVQEIADALGYSRSYLCSRFRELAGMTLTQYIQQEKIFEAQRLLRFTDRSLSELAALLAFSSQAHFQTVFKKIAGETPVQYRNRMR